MPSKKTKGGVLRWLEVVRERELLEDGVREKGNIVAHVFSVSTLLEQLQCRTTCY